MRELLLGDEAVAIAAIDAGISGAFSYPGTPATEILEFIQRRVESGTCDRPIAARWSANEKVAYEEALGMSYVGRRALVSMKHVGLNVAADPFINSATTGAHGSLVLAVADDPGMHSSQNEQDSRFYGDFAQIPIFEASNQQDANPLPPFQGGKQGGSRRPSAPACLETSVPSCLLPDFLLASRLSTFRRFDVLTF